MLGDIGLLISQEKFRKDVLLLNLNISWHTQCVIFLDILLSKYLFMYLKRN